MKAKNIEIVFSFSNSEVVPATIHWEQVNNEIYFGGNDIPVLSGQKTSLMRVFMDLWENGFCVQEGFAQRRKNKSNKFFTNIRFMFQNGSSKPALNEKMLAQGFKKLVTEAFWNIKVFDHGETITLACSFRHTRVESGKVIRVWNKDPKTGEKIGAGPYPEAPSATLRFSKEKGFFGS